MKAAYLIKPKQFAIQDLEKPKPTPGEVLVQVRHAGICGSDLHFFEHGRIGETILKQPFVMGHEFSGVIEDNGGLSGMPNVGARVAVDPALHCGTCVYCRQGRSNICPNVKFTGFPPYPGAYTEWISVSPECIYPIPDSIPDEQGPLLETLAVAVHALEVMPDVAGKTCAVIGAGTVGLLMLGLLVKRGARVVLTSEPVPERREFALRLGSEHAFHPDETDKIKAALKQTTTYGPEFIFEAAGEPESFQDAIDWIAPGGRIAFVGIYAPGSMPIDFTQARRCEMESIFVRRSLPRNYPEAIRLAESKTIDLAPFASHRFDLNAINPAFELASSRADGVIKAILTIGPS